MARQITLWIVLLTLAGCSSFSQPGYIKANHPYIRKISGDYTQIVNSVRVILAQEGWKVQKQINPSVYERRPGGEDQSRDILLITQSQRNSKIVYSTSSHLNIFIHAFADGAEIEIRYQLLTPFSSGVRNDKLVNHLFDQIEEELESK